MSVYSRRCDVSRTDSPSRLRKYHAQPRLEDRSQIGSAVRAKDPLDLGQVRRLLRDVFHDHRRAHEVERPVRDRGNRVRRSHHGLDPREVGCDSREPRGCEVDGVDRSTRGDEAAALERSEERSVTAAEVGEREWAGGKVALEQPRKPRRFEVECGLRVLLGHRGEITRAPACSRPSLLRSSRL